jgi:hypothetical protein
LAGEEPGRLIFGTLRGKPFLRPSPRSLLSSMVRDISAKALVVSILVMAVLAVYRFYNYWTTGFYVSDEFGYFYYAVHGLIYTDRWFFSWMNIVLFRALGITNADSFSYFLPLHIVFFASLTLVVFYKLLKLLEFDDRTVALSILSSFVLIAFVLLSLGFLTEPVGLSMTMIGIYFLARLAKSHSAKGLVGFSFLASCFFGFAAGTREPYNAFLIAGTLIVTWLVVAKRGELQGTRGVPSRALPLVAIAAFVIPSLFFLFVSTNAFGQQVAPISSQLFQTIATNPVTSGHVPWYRHYVLTNTLLIFFGGIFLGWGPIAFTIALIGFVIVFRRSVRQKDRMNRLVLFTAITALGSYFVVSFIYARSPYYFSFENYSTVIRFSDTALPAYFLLAPVFLAFVSKSRKRVVALAAIGILFLLVAVPVYETYASSNLGYTSNQNPFQLGYQTDALQLRNYFDSHVVGNQSVDLVGVPYGWPFTPGVPDLRSVDAYAIGVNPFVTQLTLSNFTSFRWPTIYLFVMTSQSFSPNAQSLAELINSTSGEKSTVPLPFAVVSSQIVLRGEDFTMYQVQLEWS